MKRNHHILVALVMLFIWGLFYTAGIPSNYYMTWDTTSLILLTFLAVFAIVPFVGGVTLVLLPGPFLRNSLWIAFYASVIPLLMDFFLVGIISGKGFAFFISHWFLTLGYIYVWLIIPLVGLSLQKYQARLKTV